MEVEHSFSRSLAENHSSCHHQGPRQELPTTGASTSQPSFSLGTMTVTPLLLEAKFSLF